MSKDFRIANFFEVLFWGILALILSLVKINFPMTFIISIVLSIIPITIITVKYNNLTSLVVSFTILGVLLFRMPVVFAFIKFFTICVCGISIGYCLKNKYSLNFSIIVGMTALSISFIFSHILIKVLLGINIIQELYINEIVKFFDIFKVNTNSFDLFFKAINENKLQEYAQQLMQFQSWWMILFMIEMFILLSLIGSSKISMLYIIIPGCIILLYLIISYFIIIVSWKLDNNSSYKIQPFSNFKLPFGFGVAFIIIQTILWINNIQDNISTFIMILLNIMLILNFGFMVQGMAVIDYWVKSKIIKNNGRILIYAIAMFFLIPFIPFISMAFVVAGIMDYLMDFRKLEEE